MKKGISWSLETIIVLVLLVVLILMIILLKGKGINLIEKIKDIVTFR